VIWALKNLAPKLSNFISQKIISINRLILSVTNFSPCQIADFLSEVFVLVVFLNDDEVALTQPDIGLILDF